MRALHTVVLVCIIGFVLANHDVVCRFRRFRVNPDVIYKSPREFLQVKFGNNSVELGNELTPTEVKDMPEVHYHHAESVFYLLAMIDPDVPSRENPIYREFRHWLVGNIPGEDISKGEVLAEFIGATPPKGTGFHRYVLLVYEQPGKIEYDEPRLTNKTTDGRENFSIRNFAAKYYLGDPVAGNLYRAQYED